jgi:hypothetical protein
MKLRNYEIKKVMKLKSYEVINIKMYSLFNKIFQLKNDFFRSDHNCGFISDFLNFAVNKVNTIVAIS